MVKDIPAILFIDMLGVRERWLHGGRDAAEKAFQQFREIINIAIKSETTVSIISGVIESDSVALHCKTVKAACRISKRIFTTAFNEVGPTTLTRVWLRGVITSALEVNALKFNTTPICAFPQITSIGYSSSLLDAISIEKSGFKGMRIIVGGIGITKKLLQQRVQRIYLESDATPNSEKSFEPFRKLINLGYPKQISHGYRDFLWMATEDKEEWKALCKTMVKRLKLSAGHPQEFLHAATTQTVFHECGGLFGSVMASAVDPTTDIAP